MANNKISQVALLSSGFDWTPIWGGGLAFTVSLKTSYQLKLFLTLAITLTLS